MYRFWNYLMMYRFWNYLMEVLALACLPLQDIVWRGPETSSDKPGSEPLDYLVLIPLPVFASPT